MIAIFFERAWRHRLLLVLACIVSFSAATLATARPSEQITLAEIESDLQVVQRLVLDGIPAEEMRKANNLKLVIPNRLDTQLVGAYVEGDTWVVQIPVGFYVRVYEMCKALSVLPANAWAEPLLLPYLHYLSLAELFDRPLLEFGDYIEAVRPGLPKPVFKTEPMMRNAANGMLLSSLGFVVAHELAHHLRGHTAPDSFAAGQTQEIEADAEAMRYAVNAGLNPFPAVFTFLLLAKAQDWILPVSPFSRHPAPLSRGVLLAETAALQVRNSSGLARARLTADGRYPIEPIANSLTTLAGMIRHLHLAQQDLSTAGKVKLMEQVDQGSVQATLKVARLHATGESSEIVYDPERAAIWAALAAHVATPSSLVDYAHAYYAAAWYRVLHEEVKPDLDAACGFARKAASVGYKPGLGIVTKLRSLGHCQ